MPKAPKLKQKTKHIPLDVQIRDSEEPGILRRPRAVSKKSGRSSNKGRKPLSGKARATPSSEAVATSQPNSSDDELVEESFVNAQMSKKILKQVEQQQQEIAVEDDDAEISFFSAGRSKHLNKAAREQQAAENIENIIAEDDDQDDDEEQEEHDLDDGYAGDCAISAEGVYCCLIFDESMFC